MDKEVLEVLGKAFDRHDIYFNSLQGCIEMTIGNFEEQLSILAYELEKLFNPELVKEEEQKSEQELIDFVNGHVEFDIDEDEFKELEEYYKQHPEEKVLIEVKEPTQEELTDEIDIIMNQISEWKMIYNKYKSEKQDYDKYFHVEPHPLFDCPNFEDNHI